MKTIYILLTRSNTCISNAIHLFTADPYTHASISFDSDLETLYSFARKYMYTPLPAGLRTEQLHAGFFKKNGTIPCALYALEVSDEIYEEAKCRVKEMMSHSEEYRYSIMGLLLCKMGIPYHRDRYYFCSEFVSEILERSEALALPKHISLMRPYDYTQISACSCIYEGQLDQLHISKHRAANG